MLIQEIKSEKNHSQLFTELLCNNLYSEDYAMLFYIWLFGFCTWTPTNLKNVNIV